MRYLTIKKHFTLVAALLILMASSTHAFAGLDLAALDISKIQLGSVHAAVYDVQSGDALLEKHASAVVPVASITKLMTAMVVLDAKLPLNERVKIVPFDKSIEKNAYSRIRIGSKLKRSDLLLISVMSSENLAAFNLAKSYPGGFDVFVKAMNDKAKSLGMHSTRFSDPSGLMLGNVSTASDLVKMVLAANKYPLIKKYTTTSVHTANFRKPRYRLGYGNTNPLVRSSRWDVALSKTGYLKEAGRCLVMLTRIDGHDIAMVFLDSLGKRTPLGDAGRVKRWLKYGKSGSVAGVAKQYEKERSARYSQASLRPE